MLNLTTFVKTIKIQILNFRFQFKSSFDFKLFIMKHAGRSRFLDLVIFLKLKTQLGILLIKLRNNSFTALPFYYSKLFKSQSSIILI